MTTRKISDGVGKKIVEALKKQAEPIIEEHIEEEVPGITISDLEEPAVTPVAPIVEEQIEEVQTNITESFSENTLSFEEPQPIQQEVEAPQESQLDFLNNAFTKTPLFEESKPYFQPTQQPKYQPETEIKTDNVKVLSDLISQLPPGISKQTGAQIIKQTMEALGISMKSVLTEAQQIQEKISTSSNECLNSIQQYKQQIQAMERQVQLYHKQYNSLNELISLFVQTGI